jgi:hypothetical protein
VSRFVKWGRIPKLRHIVLRRSSALPCCACRCVRLCRLCTVSSFPDAAQVYCLIRRCTREDARCRGGAGWRCEPWSPNRLGIGRRSQCLGGFARVCWRGMKIGCRRGARSARLDGPRRMIQEADRCTAAREPSVFGAKARREPGVVRRPGPSAGVARRLLAWELSPSGHRAATPPTPHGCGDGDARRFSRSSPLSLKAIRRRMDASGSRRRVGGCRPARFSRTVGLDSRVPERLSRFRCRPGELVPCERISTRRSAGSQNAWTERIRIVSGLAPAQGIALTSGS